MNSSFITSRPGCISCFLAAVRMSGVICPFLAVSWAGMLSVIMVIVVFPGHTHFYKFFLRRYL